MTDQIMWWLFTHVQQVQTAAWTLAAIGVLAVLVGLAGIGLDRLQRTATLADALLTEPVAVFDQGRAEVVPTDGDWLDVARAVGLAGGSS